MGTARGSQQARLKSLAPMRTMPMLSRRAPTVLVDSSHARRPLPGEAIALAVAASSFLYDSSVILGCDRGLRAVKAEVAPRASARMRARAKDFILEAMTLLGGDTPVEIMSKVARGSVWHQSLPKKDPSPLPFPLLRVPLTGRC